MNAMADIATFADSELPSGLPEEPWSYDNATGHVKGKRGEWIATANVNCGSAIAKIPDMVREIERLWEEVAILVRRRGS